MTLKKLILLGIGLVTLPFIASAELPKKEGDTFAVLINNDSVDERHIGNIRSAYHTLRSQGVDPCNIYVVSDPNENVQCKNKKLKVNQEPSRVGARAAILDLERRITYQDSLVIYTTGHGVIGGIDFKDGILTYTEIRSLTELLNPGLAIGISDAGYGGGIVEEFSLTNLRHLALSNSNEDETPGCQAFSPYFWEALRYNGFDLNRDGATSLSEAFFKAFYLYQNAAGVIPLTEEEKDDLITLIRETVAEEGGKISLPDTLFYKLGLYDSTIDGRLINRN